MKAHRPLSRHTRRTGSELYEVASKGFPVTRDELSELMRCHRETVSDYVRQGMPCLYMGKVQRQAHGAKPMFIFSKCMTWLEKRNANR